jgi:hypothetical protein
MSTQCPLCLRKQTLIAAAGMSAKCHNRTHAVQQKNILTESVERDVSLLDNGLPFFHFGCEQSG